MQIFFRRKSKLGFAEWSQLDVIKKKSESLFNKYLTMFMIDFFCDQNLNRSRDSCWAIQKIKWYVTKKCHMKGGGESVPKTATIYLHSQIYSCLRFEKSSYLKNFIHKIKGKNLFMVDVHPYKINLGHCNRVYRWNFFTGQMEIYSPISFTIIIASVEK